MNKVITGILLLSFNLATPAFAETIDVVAGQSDIVRVNGCNQGEYAEVKTSVNSAHEILLKTTCKTQETEFYSTCTRDNYDALFKTIAARRCAVKRAKAKCFKNGHTKCRRGDVWSRGGRTINSPVNAGATYYGSN